MKSPLQIDALGTGGYFPIKLTVPKDENGQPMQVPVMELVDGEWVPKTVVIDGKPQIQYQDAISWRPLEGDVLLIHQNLRAIFTYMLGFKLRCEYFGTRIWECLEEPNTDVLSFTARDFIVSAIEIWEPRISAVNTKITRYGSSIYVELYYKIKTIDTLQYFTHTL